MLIHSIKDNSNIFLLDFLKQNFSKISEPNLIKNYHPDFSNESGNFFNILKNGRFNEGKYFVLEDAGIYCGSAGWHPYHYDNELVALGLVRCYLPKEYRRKWLLSKYFLPNILEETSNFKKIWLTFNEYNKGLYKGFELLSQGRNVGLGESWPKVFSKFIPIGKKTIYFTEQFVVEYNKSTL